MTVAPGQVYRSLSKRHHPVDGAIRIKVVGRPNTDPGGWRFGKVDIVTITRDGREIRRRAIEMSQLHDSGTTRDGRPRRTGYVREAATGQGPKGLKSETASVTEEPQP
ncbi:hypothetical protein [Streptomyces sp. NPDC056061]|uniref:hypothetical protein n=1 Tax=Streptomyces sp. NPDC056061 TaxID=3345700 RepID=UPI0035D5AB95